MESNIQSIIHVFWEYVSKHIKDVDMIQIQNVDMPILHEKKLNLTNWQEYAMLLSPSGVIYMTMSGLYEDIIKLYFPKVKSSFILRANDFRLNTTHPLMQKKLANKFARMGINAGDLSEYRPRFLRFWIVLTAIDGKNSIPLIEEIYNLSLGYKFPSDWQIVKHFPPEFRPDDLDSIPPFKLLQNDDAEIKYCIQGEEMIITCNHFPEVTMDTYAYCNEYLRNAFGEHAMIHKINSFSIVPESFLIMINPEIAKKLRPISEFYAREHAEIFAGTCLCTFCNLRDSNCQFKIIDHNLFNMGHEDLLPEGNYCTYCIHALEKIFIEK
jgi:hypothetical protein